MIAGSVLILTNTLLVCAVCAVCTCTYAPALAPEGRPVVRGLPHAEAEVPDPTGLVGAAPHERSVAAHGHHGGHRDNHSDFGQRVGG